MSQKILLIEDNRSLVAALVEALQNDYEINYALSGKNGLYQATINQPDLIILDLQLPDTNGLAVCQQLRERGITVPILILSAEAKVLSKINLLDAGAQDYLTKPFSLGELKARLRVLLREANQHTDIPLAIPSVLTVGDVSLNSSTHEVTRAGQPIQLRRKEFLLLECLLTNAGNVVSREQLVRFAWHGLEKPWANTVDVHMKYLRDKIDRPFETSIIQTVHGIGYKLRLTSIDNHVALDSSSNADASTQKQEEIVV